MASSEENYQAPKSAPVRDGIVHSPYPPRRIPRCSVYEAIRRQMEKHLSNIVIIQDNKNITTEELLLQFEHYAAALQHGGLHRGDVVCCCLSNRSENVAPLYSVIFAGSVVLLSAGGLSKEDLIFQIRNANARYVLTDSEHAPKIKSLLEEVELKKVFMVGGCFPGFVSLSELLQDTGKSFKRVPVESPEDELAAISYSSGTTGVPKAVAITHYTIVARLTIQSSLGMVRAKDMVLCCDHLTHLFTFNYILDIMSSGATAVMTPPLPHFDKITQAIAEHKVNLFFAFPAMLHGITEAMEKTGQRLPSVKKILFGGAPLTDAVESRIRERFDLHSFHNSYGMTECFGAVAASPPGEMCFENLGFLCCNMEIKVVDVETGKILGPGAHGELCIRGPTVTSGIYAGGKQILPVTDEDGFLHSGDLGYYNEAGRIFYVERLKHLIKCLGYAVLPAELEGVLLQHPGVAEAAVVGVPNPRYSEAPTAFVVRMKNIGPGEGVTEDELQNFIAGKVAWYKRLYGGVRFVDALPKTENGKILRRQLVHKTLQQEI